MTIVSIPSLRRLAEEFFDQIMLVSSPDADALDRTYICISLCNFFTFVLMRLDDKKFADLDYEDIFKRWIDMEHLIWDDDMHKLLRHTIFKK